MKVSQLGWVVSALLMGAMAGTGFQTKPAKIGFIDMASVFGDSDLRKRMQDQVNALKQSRQDILTFLQLNSTFSRDQLNRYKALATKTPLTPAEKSELDKIVLDVQAATKQYDDLRQKQNPTQADIIQLNDLGARNSLTKQAHDAWAQDFTQEVGAFGQSQESKAAQLVTQAIREVAEKQSFTLIFSEKAAVYGANDIGPEVKKLVDKNK